MRGILWSFFLLLHQPLFVSRHAFDQYWFLKFWISVSMLLDVHTYTTTYYLDITLVGSFWNWYNQEKVEFGDFSLIASINQED